MYPGFNESNFIFEYLPFTSNVSTPIKEINGWGLLFTSDAGDYIGFSTFSFDESISDSLIKEKYHHQIIQTIDSALELRNKSNSSPVGGALVKIENGDIYFCWMSMIELERIEAEYRHSQAVAKLNSAYKKILSEADTAALFSKHPELSGMFLACPSLSYFNSSPRVLVVGQEPGGWRKKTCPIKIQDMINDDVLATSMNITQAFPLSNGKKSVFLKFYRKVASRISADRSNAPVWSNQFCLSYKSKSPAKLPNESFDIVKKLSFSLLKAQVDILEPEVIIFTTGPSRDKYLKECFPGYKTVEVIEPRRLWHFKVGGAHCLRTSHPRWTKGSVYLKRAITMIKDLR